MAIRWTKNNNLTVHLVRGVLLCDTALKAANENNPSGIMPFAGFIPLHSLEGTQPIYRNFKYTRPTRRGERRREGSYQGGVGVPSVVVQAGLFLTMIMGEEEREEEEEEKEEKETREKPDPNKNPRYREFGGSYRLAFPRSMLGLSGSVPHMNGQKKAQNKRVLLKSPSFRCNETPESIRQDFQWWRRSFPRKRTMKRSLSEGFLTPKETFSNRPPNREQRERFSR